MSEERKYAVEMPEIIHRIEDDWCRARKVQFAFDKMQDEIDRLNFAIKVNHDENMQLIAHLKSELAAEREKSAKAREYALREAAMEVELALCGIPNASEQIQNGRDKKAILALIDTEGAK